MVAFIPLDACKKEVSKVSSGAQTWFRYIFVI